MKYLAIIAVFIAAAFPPTSFGQEMTNGEKDADQSSAASQFATIVADEGSPVPRNSPGEWIVQDDFPAKANREGRGGSVAFNLQIGTNGRVTSCEIAISSGHADLDETTCRLVTKRARFEPAKNEAGEAVDGTYRGTVKWLASRNKLPEPFESSIEIVIGVDGRITSCRILEVKGTPPTEISDEEICPFLSLTNYEPPRDSEGDPFVRRLVMTSKWTIEDEVPQE